MTKGWKTGIIYNALHAVGDDPLKGMIEDKFVEVFDKKTLDKIADVFRDCIREYEGEEI